MRQFFVAFAVAVSLLTFGNPAKAQYTTKSSSTQSAAKPAAQQQARPAAAPSRATAAQTRSNLYRPRNQPVQDTGEEDLPSFEAMDANGGDKAAQEGASEQPASTGGNAYFNMVQQRRAKEAEQTKGAEQKTGKEAQQSAQAAAEPKGPAMPKGEVWAYITDFSTDKVGRFTICNYKHVLQNKTDTEIERLVLLYQWAGKTLTQEYRSVKPKENVVVTSASYEDNCEVMRAKPKMTVQTCRIGAAVKEACEKLIIQK